MKYYIILFMFIFVNVGCTAINKGAETAGAISGNTIGTINKVSEKGAEAMQGDEQPNPYNR